MWGLCPLPADAKEDTARLVFKKQAPRLQRTEAYTYTVKKSEHLLDIVKNELGITKHRYSIIRRYNPHITNLNLIRPGQKIFLPLKLRKAVHMEGREITSDDSAEKKGTIQSGKGLPPPGRLTAMQAVLQRMNGSITISGRYVIPLPEIGQITIDCEMIPVIEFDDGSVVFMDFKNQMPENVRKLIRRHWANYSVLRADGRHGAMDILSGAVNTSKTYTMKRMSASFLHGQKPAVKLPVDWLITRIPSAGKAPSYTQAIFLLKTDEGRLPKSLADYLRRTRFVVTELLNETVLAPLPETAAKTAFPPIPRLNSTSQKEVIISLLKHLGWQVSTDADVQIFDAAKDGFNLSIKADIQARMGGKGFLFLSKPLPRQFVDILHGRALEIIVFSSSDSSRQTIEKTLSGMKVPYSTIPYMFPVSSHSSLNAVKVIFPTIRIPSEKSGPIYLIDFAMDPDVYSLLCSQMGFTILQY